MIALNGVSKFFTVRSGFLSRHRQTVRALQNVSIEIREKEILGLVGESGSGKSTLARVIMGLYAPDEGYFTVDGHDSRTMKRNDWQNLRRDIGLVFQDPASSMNPWMTVEQIVGEPIVIRKRELRLTRAVRRERVAEILAATGMPAETMGRRIHEFSGGQRQRIAIARALVLKPRYLILDEPISALDVSIQAQILNLLKDLHTRYGFAALFITHDLSKVRWFSDRVAVMYLGRIVETAAAATIFERSRHPYTRALGLSRLDTDFTQRDFYTLPGEIPSPMKAPPGCPFAPRCERAIARCTSAFPPAATDTPHQGEYHCYNPIAL